MFNKFCATVWVKHNTIANHRIFISEWIIQLNLEDVEQHIQLDLDEYI